MDITFEQLPQAVGQLADKLDRIEKLLQKQTPPIHPDRDKFINIDEAGKLLNLAKATIYGLVSAGKIPYIKQGKKLHFSQDELTNWLRQGHKCVADDLATRVDTALLGIKGKRRGW